ncbi:hypothetical protein QQ045_011139 [Rhodiola kirilowii]
MKSDIDSESAKIEQIASKFFSKCLHVILESRYICSSSRNVGVQKVYSDVTKWDRSLNLALRDCSLVLENTGVHYSMQFAVDLVLSRKSHNMNSSGGNGDGNNLCWERKRGKVIERWVMMYEGEKVRDNTGGLKGSCKSRIFYKKCVLMLRSLYLMVKLLPAYKLFKKLTKSPELCDFSLVHHVSSFVEPFTREEEAEMLKYVFDPVETSYGSLCLSVFYFEPSNRMLQLLIKADYCRGMLVDPGFRPPMLHANGKVLYGSKSQGRGRKPSLTTESGYYVITQTDLPKNSRINAHTKETTAKGIMGKTPCSSKSQCSPMRKASSTSPIGNRPNAAKTSPHPEMSICPYDFSRSALDECRNPEECGDPFQPKLSNNAAIGSLFSIFHTAAPLRRTSTSQQNTANLHPTSTIFPANPTVKTTSNALLELQGFIDMKNKILQRSSNRSQNCDHCNTTIESYAVGQDSTQVSKS